MAFDELMVFNDGTPNIGNQFRNLLTSNRFSAVNPILNRRRPSAKLDLAEFDPAVAGQFTQQAAAPDIARLRTALNRATANIRDTGTPSGAFARRQAVEGFGTGLGETLRGARQFGLAQEAQQRGVTNQEAIANFQAELQRERQDFQSIWAQLAFQQQRNQTRGLPATPRGGSFGATSRPFESYRDFSASQGIELDARGLPIGDRIGVGTKAVKPKV